MFINVTHGTAGHRVSRKGCVPAGCTTPVNCPGVLRVKAAGSVVGCESACARFGTDQYCCRAQWAPRAACNPAQWPVDYAAVFKKAEPYAYSYADDDATITPAGSSHQASTPAPCTSNAVRASARTTTAAPRQSSPMTKSYQNAPNEGSQRLIGRPPQE